MSSAGGTQHNTVAHDHTHSVAACAAMLSAAGNADSSCSLSWRPGHGTGDQWALPCRVHATRERTGLIVAAGYAAHVSTFCAKQFKRQCNCNVPVGTRVREVSSLTHHVHCTAQQHCSDSHCAAFIAHARHDPTALLRQANGNVVALGAMHCGAVLTGQL
jgi:hypothetical protein